MCIFEDMCFYSKILAFIFWYVLDLKLCGNMFLYGMLCFHMLSFVLSLYCATIFLTIFQPAVVCILVVCLLEATNFIVPQYGLLFSRPWSPKSRVFLLEEPASPPPRLSVVRLVGYIQLSNHQPYVPIIYIYICHIKSSSYNIISPQHPPF